MYALMHQKLGRMHTTSHSSLGNLHGSICCNSWDTAEFQHLAEVRQTHTHTNTRERFPVCTLFKISPHMSITLCLNTKFDTVEIDSSFCYLTMRPHPAVSGPLTCAGGQPEPDGWEWPGSRCGSGFSPQTQSLWPSARSASFNLPDWGKRGAKCV